MLDLTRTWAVMAKEFVQLTRDRLTYAMILMLPIVILDPYRKADRGIAEFERGEMVAATAKTVGTADGEYLEPDRRAALGGADCRLGERA